jgi:hypothetical protein
LRKYWPRKPPHGLQQLEGDIEMPMQSEQQRKAMHAAAAGKSNIGIPKDVGKKFAAHDQGGKLPKKVGQYALPKSKGMMDEEDNC